LEKHIKINNIQEERQKNFEYFEKEKAIKLNEYQNELKNIKNERME
jgi:hypothetical protein